MADRTKHRRIVDERIDTSKRVPSTVDDLLPTRSLRKVQRQRYDTPISLLRLSSQLLQRLLRSRRGEDVEAAFDKRTHGFVPDSSRSSRNYGAAPLHRDNLGILVSGHRQQIPRARRPRETRMYSVVNTGRPFPETAWDSRAGQREGPSSKWKRPRSSTTGRSGSGRRESSGCCRHGITNEHIPYRRKRDCAAPTHHRLIAVPPSHPVWADFEESPSDRKFLV